MRSGKEEATIREFAEHQHLKLRQDECGDLFIPGKFGQVFQYDSDRLAVMFLGSTKRKWNAFRRKLEAAAFEVMQDVGTEGSALFDPSNPKQCRIAIRIIRAKPRRILSAAQREQLRAARKKAAVSRNRESVWARGGFSENFESPATGTAPGSSPPESRPFEGPERSSV